MAPIVTVLDPYHEEAVKYICAQSHIEVVLPGDARKAQWHEFSTGVLVRSDTRITAADFEKAKHLEFIVKQGVGVDNIDLEAAKKHSVIVCNTPALNSEAVAELTLTLGLCLGRRVCEIDRKIRAGEKVVRSKMLAQSLFEKKVGIVGMGNIGRETALKWIGAMKCQILAYDPFHPGWDDIPHKRIANLDELLAEADLITLHVPLIDATKNLIDDAAFAKMKPNAILINCSRGGIVDEHALLKALQEDRIYGAGLDATVIEPPMLSDYEDLLSTGKCIITPHVGASTVENQINSGKAAVNVLLDCLAGRELKSRVV